jgi:capsular polysaccharide biosynthesis protein/Mrp family chromosome partitioning ATPase
MSNDAELSISELRKKRAQASSKPANVAQEQGQESGALEPVVIESQPRQTQTYVEMPRGVTSSGAGGGRVDDDEKVELPFDPWRLPEAIRKKWYWLILAGIVLGVAGGVLGYWRTKYAVRLTLNLNDVNNPRWAPTQDSESYKPPQYSSQTLINFLTDPRLIRAVSSAAQPPITETKLSSSIKVTPEKNSETISVVLEGRDVKALVDLANLYATNAVELSKLVQRADPELTLSLYSNQFVKAQTELTNYHKKLTDFRKDSELIDPEVQHSSYAKQLVEVLNRLDEIKTQKELSAGKAEILRTEPIRKQLQEAEARLAELRNKLYTDEHPDVQRRLNQIKSLKEQLVEANKPSSASSSSPGDEESTLRKQLDLEVTELKKRATDLEQKLNAIDNHASEYVQIKAGIDFQESLLKKLKSRGFEAQQYLESAGGYYSFSPVLLKDVDKRSRYKKGIIFAFVGGVLGVFASMMLVVVVEVIDPRLKTVADVRRVSNLPVLASLGDLNGMDDAARKAWAFRTWTILSGTLSQSSNQGTVCGFISCSHGEGRSTWVEMLVEAARERGFEVTKLQFGEDEHEPQTQSGHIQTPTPGENSSNGSAAAGKSSDTEQLRRSIVEVTSVRPNMAVGQAASVIHVELPGLVWNLQRRIQFQDELAKWRSVSNSVVLIDLPPASMPEAILLAENLPQVIWLVDSGKSHARETRMHLETLRHARCKLVGAVLNHEPEPLIKL